MSKTRARVMRFLVFGSLALFISAAYVWLSEPREPAKIDHDISVAGIELGGTYELVNHLGETVTDDTYKNDYKIIYFGFTYCPAICPAELQKIAAGLRLLADGGKDITTLFISVDPERDTVEVMREYIGLFDANLTGLTGSSKQVQRVLKQYKVYAAKVESEESTDYTMDHSSFIYFMGPDDKLLKIFRTQDDAEYIADSIRTILHRARSG